MGTQGRGLWGHGTKGNRVVLDTHGQEAGRERAYKVVTGKELAGVRSRKGRDRVNNKKEK